MNLSLDPAKRFLIACALASISLVLIMVSLNFFIDRYYVFHPQDGVFEEILEPNTRVLKATYLARHCSEFDAMIMGSSRDVAYRTADVDSVFAVHSYNYSVASGNLRDILGRLEWLAGLGCMPARIFLPVSIDSLKLPSHGNDLLRKEYPGIVGAAAYRREFILSYIGTDAVLSNLRKLFELLGKDRQARFRYDMKTGDVAYLWQRDFPIRACPEETFAADADTRQLFVDYLLAIRTLAREHSAEITLIWNPIPLDEQLAFAADGRALLEQLSGSFSEIYRLPLSDPRLRDNANYHDHGHFKAGLGAAVLRSAVRGQSPGSLAAELQAAALACENQERLF